MYIFFDSRHDYEGYPPVSGQYEFTNENVKAREKVFFWRVIQQLRSYLKVPFSEMDLAEIGINRKAFIKGRLAGRFFSKIHQFPCNPLWAL